MSNLKLQSSRRAFLSAVVASPLLAATANSNTDGQWIDLFDGRTLNAWQPSENKASWKVQDGMLTADGPRSHLFYQGPVQGADFRNFELEVELTTQSGCNSGVYFHTAYQEKGFPEKGFEVQVNNTALGDGGYLERKKTASLYGIRNIYKQLVADGEPFRMRVAVRGKNVQIHLNDLLVVDYVEPTPPVIPTGGENGRYLDHGTIALQCHNDGSRAAYRQVRVRPLSENLPFYTAEKPAPVVDKMFRQVINVGRHNIPIVDYNVALVEGMSLDEALRKSRADGLQFGIAARTANLKSPQDALRVVDVCTGRPAFAALVADEPNWMASVPQGVAKKFDYMIAAPHSNSQLPVGTDPQQAMDRLVQQVVRRLDTEPIDIYSNITALPPALQTQADQLWTEARRSQLVEALLRNHVAVELNTLSRLPDHTFVRQAAAAGVKFGFGTGNRSKAELQRCEYGLLTVEACKLDWRNFFAPGAWWPKAADRNGSRFTS